ncbi:PDZ/DHR/GLGF domain protein, partial [Teladorsagia circumcincta]
KQVSRSKFWGEARTVVLEREPNKSFGISIVGGRVEVSQKGGLPGTGSTVSGIFIKSVLPNSPAGRSGMMNMGDRVISECKPKYFQVNDIDLREATHEQAVNAIKNATNPVRFVLQSLHSFTPQQQMIGSNTHSLTSARVETAKSEETPQPPPPPEPTIEHEVDKESKESPKKEPEMEKITEEPASEQPVSSEAAEEPMTAAEEPITKEEEKPEEVEQVATSEPVSEPQPSPSKSKQSEEEEQEPEVLESPKAHEDEPSTSTAQVRYPTTSAEPTISPSTSAAELPKDPDDDEKETKFGYTQ